MNAVVLLVALAARQDGVDGPEIPRGEQRQPLPRGQEDSEKSDFRDDPTKPPRVRVARLDAVLRWNEVALDAIRAERTPPPMAARTLAMMHGAVADAVNSIYQTHRPYRVRLVATEPAEPEAAAAAAAHRVLRAAYPRRAARLDAALESSLAAVADGKAKKQGILIGRHVADRMIAWRRTDGTDRRASHPGARVVGVWRPTLPNYAPALYPQWPAVTTFSGLKTSQFRPAPPPELTSEEYARDFNEVKRLGGLKSRKRTAEQTIIAWFWDDGAGTCTPPGHWNLIARAVALEQQTSLAENARAFALLNIALADAGIVCWDCKYRFRLWRPITAIREADRDGNDATVPDRTWDSLLATPPFPSYTSGHSTFSGAGSAVLAEVFGSDGIAFTVGTDGLPGTRRRYRTFSQAADEAGKSRIYGGIHYECDNREGLAAGRALAREVVRSLLRPIEQSGSAAPQSRQR
jgi:hypothetical protein